MADDIFIRVKHFYDTNFHDLSAKKRFHYASRLYLFAGYSEYQPKLAEVRSEWFGAPEALIRDITRVSEVKTPEVKLIDKSAYKRVYYERHPKVTVYNKVFFKLLFREAVFGERDLQIEDQINTSDLVDTFTQLCADPEALLYLSTPAVNFVYLAERYLPDSVNPISPAHLLRTLMTPDRAHDADTELRSRIYFGTHMIVNATNFYQVNVITKDIAVYKRTLEYVETLIEDNFFDTNLDQKFEFIVCTRVLGQRSRLEPSILAEAQQSLSLHGDYFTNTKNAFASEGMNMSFQSVEHSNVLALMAFLP